MSDELMKLAQQAGGTVHFESSSISFAPEEFARFARLIRQQERERCAKHFDDSDTMIYRSEVAAAIRALKD